MKSIQTDLSRTVIGRRLVIGAALILGAAIMVWIARQSNENRPSLPASALDPALAASPEVIAVLERSCADCHSDGTRWPWYSHIPPVSWLLTRDVEHAKRAVNLSHWPRHDAWTQSEAVGRLSAACTAVQSEKMPPRRYVLLHPNSRLSRSDVKLLCEWTKNQIAKMTSSLEEIRRAPSMAR